MRDQKYTGIMVTHRKNYAIRKLRKKLKKNNSVHIHKTVKNDQGNHKFRFRER